MQPIEKLEASVVALKDQFGGMQEDVRQIRTHVRQIHEGVGKLEQGVDKLNVGMIGVIATVSDMQEGVTELGVSLSAVAKKQSEQATILQEHQKAIEELQKKVNGGK